MTIAVAPYLQFTDATREAMELYQRVLGGEVGFSTYGEFGMGETEADKAKIMHSQIVKDGVAVLMAADSPMPIPADQQPTVAVSLFGGVEDAQEMHRQWDLLADGAQVVMETLQKAPWGDEFGMLIDRFGTYWMVNIGGGEG
ncbi:MAG: VOC family protein [Salana multivorans]|uniref:VOC family protein n=1 Tax=Salana multivorans TaxID=120377 RepID=UPI00095FDC1C|nr:VOC family protein [Salana multivorans]MBN8881252.1 VOC family protein [Salana multivorans]OJX94812.1 MAG: hypothetical protein BGO96_01825 [Micrococcales bacterium 73-15]